MEHLIFSLATAIDLLALVTCLGTLSCRLWVLPPSGAGEDTVVLCSLRAALWRLLGGYLIALTMSSVGELLERTRGHRGHATPRRPRGPARSGTPTASRCRTDHGDPRG